MTQRPVLSKLAPLFAFALAVSVEAQDEGVKRVEQLIKKATATVEAITDAKLQLSKTMDVYNSIFLDEAKDRKGIYKKLQKEMQTTEERRAAIGRHTADMDLEADALFKSWATSAATIQSPELRKQSDERLAKTKARYAEIHASGQKAGEIYAPLMKALQDQVTYLGHDLNPEALASLRGEATKLNTQAQQLSKSVDDTIAVANTNIAALRP